MEHYIPISYLNDFIFCPRSIYFHQLYGQYAHTVYKQKPQIEGTAAHKNIDEHTYSSSKSILMDYELYIAKYKIHGKLDVFDIKTGTIRERKKKIVTLYDGYIYQVYAQYFGLLELGYEVNKIVIHCLTHNKNYPIPLPHENMEMLTKFENTITQLNAFKMEDKFTPILEKCTNCIYNNLCDKSLC